DTELSNRKWYRAIAVPRDPSGPNDRGILRLICSDHPPKLAFNRPAIIKVGLLGCWDCPRNIGDAGCFTDDKVQQGQGQHRPKDNTENPAAKLGVDNSPQSFHRALAQN